MFFFATYKLYDDIRISCVRSGSTAAATAAAAAAAAGLSVYGTLARKSPFSRCF